MKFIEEFKNKKLEKIAKEIDGKLCNHCLGRQFAHVSTGLSDEERGIAIRKELGTKECKKCMLCKNIFDDIDEYVEKIIKQLEKIDFKTFEIGTKLTPELVKSEESLWEEIGIEYCETLKSEINREIGKKIEKKTKKRYEQNPDVRIVVNLGKKNIELEIKSLFFYGMYSKLVRGIPQTKWDKYKTSVEDIIANPFMKQTNGNGHSFHAAGREDIDARCLGKRPFVLEIKNPKKRKINLAEAVKIVNASKKVKVAHLKQTDKSMVKKVKEIRPEKTYRVLVEFEKPINGEDKIKSLNGKTINQKTPERVLHRRTDLLRKRKVKSIKYQKITNKKLEIEIKGEAGLYIKELVTGDNNRTEPSISGILGNQGKVLELDVIKIWI